MLDMKFVRQNPDAVKAALVKRHVDINLDNFLAIDQKRREALVKMEEMKAKSNKVSQDVGRMKKAGENADAVMAEMKELKIEIKEIEEAVRNFDADLLQELLYIPNIPHESVPTGNDEDDNLEVSRWGEPKKFDFEPKPHWDIGEALNILDFERGSKVTGARFTFYRGMGARLERALISFFLDVHTEQHGYEELFPPFIANKESLTATGQLPKFAEDMFRLEGTDYYLIPTAEVPVTNYFRGEILDNDILPKY
ncbi:MAG: serine--tRNA ligase, partial [Clostridiales bacterium]